MGFDIEVLKIYLTPSVGAMAVYVYLYMLEKIEFHTLHLIIYIFIGAVVGAWSVELIINLGVDMKLSNSLGGFIGILTPQIMEWLVGGKALTEILERLGRKK